eukprot:IDg14224t1
MHNRSAISSAMSKVSQSPRSGIICTITMYAICTSESYETRVTPPNVTEYWKAAAENVTMKTLNHFYLFAFGLSTDHVYRSDAVTLSELFSQAE